MSGGEETIPVQSQPSDDRTSVSSTLSSLKEIITIVSGLALTNGVVIFLTGGDYAKVRSFMELVPQTVTPFLLLVVNVIRFYHGNVRHLDTVYLSESEMGDSGDVKRVQRGRIAIDFFVIFAETVLFAVLSFYLGKPMEFYVIFTGLLMVDVLWFLCASQYTPDREALAHQKKWTLNNTGAVFAFLVVIAASSVIESFVPSGSYYLSSAIGTANTIVDFVISWGFYFPSFHTERS